MRVGQDLHFHVSWANDRPLKEDALVPECRARLPSGTRERIAERPLFADELHADTASAGERLHHDRVADAPGGREEGVVSLIRAALIR